MNEGSDQAGQNFQLVVPFVNVTSKGGRYDDQSYAAGWSMGVVDYRLRTEQPDMLSETLRVEDIKQAHTVADAAGYVLDHEWSGVGEWAYCKFVRKTPGPTPV